MLEISVLAAALLIIPVEPLGCDDLYEIPHRITQELSGKKGNIIEITQKDPTGYITGFFYNRLYVEGWFFERDGEIVVCEITFAIEFDEQGALLFVWHRDQKES